MKTLLILLFISLIFTSCYSDKYEELYPLNNYVNDCDTTLADTYTASVLLIINNNCASCHNSNNKSGNLDLTNYSNVMSSVNSGKLMGSVKYSPGFKAMPPYSSLQQCEIDRLQRWVNTSMPQ